MLALDPPPLANRRWKEPPPELLPADEAVGVSVPSPPTAPPLPELADQDATPDFEPEPPPRIAALIARLGMPVPDEPPPAAEPAEAAPAKRTLWRTIRTAPAWLVSLVLHLAAVIVLALYSIPAIREQFVFEIYAESVGEQLSEEVLETPVAVEMLVDTPGVAFSETLFNDALAAPPITDLITDSGESAGNIRTPEIGLSLSGRSAGKKGALLAAYGGNAATEEAVQLGLDWLRRRQTKDGGWKLASGYKNHGSQENRVAATAMALLAFQGAGNTHQEGDHVEPVKRGWAFLLKQQKDDGYFHYPGAQHHQLYAHAQATIALCEIYGMTKDPNIRKPAQRALDYCYRIQSPEGGWRYVPYKDADMSVTGWFVMAMQSGRMAGLDCQSPAEDLVCKYIDSVQTDGGAQYGYQSGSGPSIPLTAEALLCRQYLGWQRDDERLQRGVKILLDNPIKMAARDRNVYYWYYATQVCHHMDGDEWDQWNRDLRSKIPNSQEREGPEAGSWSPVGDRWGNQVGRLYTTCMSIYLLEVYYRHLPIYNVRLK